MKLNTNSLDLSSSIYILRFYYSLLVTEVFISSIVIFLGFLSRAITVFVFVITLKIFLSVLEPSALIGFLENGIGAYMDLDLGVDQIIIILVGGLGLLVIFQLLLNKVYLKFFLRLRTLFQKRLLLSELNQHELTRIHIAIDKFPQGFEAVIKLSEILLFYLILLAAIFSLSMFAGLALVLLVPSIVIVMVIIGRKQIHTEMEIRDSRKDLVGKESDFNNHITLINQNYVYGRNNVIYADFFAGMSLVVIISSFILLNPVADTSLTGLPALFLVFGLRFSVIYAGELGRLLGRVVQQRVIVNKITFL